MTVSSQRDRKPLISASAKAGRTPYPGDRTGFAGCLHVQGTVRAGKGDIRQGLAEYRRDERNPQSRRLDRARRGSALGVRDHRARQGHEDPGLPQHLLASRDEAGVGQEGAGRQVFLPLSCLVQFGEQEVLCKQLAAVSEAITNDLDRAMTIAAE